MKDLVKILENNNVVTSSLNVAEYFGKRHDYVLNRIRNLLTQGTVHNHNFVETHHEFKMPTGGIRKDKIYQMDKDGFILLVMGFSGAKAHRFKLEYIKAFNKALQILDDQQRILLRRQNLLLEKAQTENRLFKIDTALKKFGKISKHSGLPRTKAVSYLRGEKKQKVSVVSNIPGLYSKPVEIDFPAVKSEIAKEV